MSRNQFFNQGAPAEAILYEGPKSTRPRNIRLGQYIDDGDRRYRWAYVNTAAEPGMVLVKSSYYTEAVSITTSALARPSAVAKNAGDGNTGGKGTDRVWLYRMSKIKDTDKYIDGTFEVISGPGKGVYYIRGYEKGLSAAGSRPTMLQIHGPLLATLTASSYGYIRPNPYYGLTLMSTNTVASGAKRKAAGAAVISLSAAGKYCLIQTRGPGIGYGGGTTVAGEPLGVTDASGSLSTATGVVSGTVPVLAYGLDAGASNAGFAVDWCIE